MMIKEINKMRQKQTSTMFQMLNKNILFKPLINLKIINKLNN